MQYADPAEAGFDTAELAAAKADWENLSSSAFMVIADGAVVTAWGATDRRFMCHSVRKSFLSAIFGIYWDRDEMELNKTLADVGIDEQGEGLLESEEQARILDLLKARSGVFHPAAYAGRTDSRPRGSEGPGRYFAYNNWDFNTLATILEKETGDSVFEAFDEHFAQPLRMEDWRPSDGYFHYELDKSKHPAYPFRLSARDAARFGLLFAREGRWGDERILSRQWVRRSTALYSKDNEQFGYGFMWWVALEPRFADHGFVAARGVGRQMIVSLPDLDMVIVNRANTYRGEGTEYQELLNLMEKVINARTGEAVAAPRLVPLADVTQPPRTAPGHRMPMADLAGEWPHPPAPLGLPQQATLRIIDRGDYLIVDAPFAGTFRHYPQEDGWFLEEDSLDRYLPIYDDDGKPAGLADAATVAQAAIAARARGDQKAARRHLARIPAGEGTQAKRTSRGSPDLSIRIADALLDLFERPKRAEKNLQSLLAEDEVRANRVEGRINVIGYQFMRADKLAEAQQVFELNTRLFPQAFNTWDSLGEVYMNQEKNAAAIESYQRSLELNPENRNAEAMIERMASGGGT
ncbi:MAG: serine hydrolase [Acidobacteriota bacterium]